MPHAGVGQCAQRRAYGYRYIGKHEGDGEARYQVVANEAQVVRKIFQWVGQDRCSIGEVCRRLKERGSRRHGRGKTAWDRSVGLGDCSRIPRTRGRRPLARRDRGRSSPRNSGPSGVVLSILGDRSLGSRQHRTIRSSSMSRRSSTRPSSTRSSSNLRRIDNANVLVLREAVTCCRD